MLSTVHEMDAAILPLHTLMLGLRSPSREQIRPLEGWLARSKEGLSLSPVSSGRPRSCSVIRP